MAGSDYPAGYLDLMLVESRRMLRDHFALLDEGVEAITRHDDNHGLIAADVFAAALAGDIQLLLVRLDGAVEGFVAVYPTRSVNGVSNLHVWLLYLRPGIPDITAEGVRELDLLAREQGCQGLTFGTTRRAWQRKLARHGYLPQSILFHRPLGGTP